MTTDDKALQPHDRIIKWVLTRPEAAGVELRHVLPAAVTEQLDWSTLKVCPGSFVDPKLITRHSDILYDIRLRDIPRSVLVYVLLEHQSSPDHLMAWRLLQYAVRVWERFIREHEGPVRHLPIIYPLVLYQGPEGWTEPRRLSDLLDLPDELREAMGAPIELTFAVDELDDAILADHHARDGILALVEAMRSLLRFACRPDEVTRERIAPMAPLFERVMATLGIDDVQALWTYVISVFEPESPLRDILVQAASQDLQTVYATIYDEAIAKGVTKGKLEGMVRGKVEMLLRLLDKRGIALTEPQRQCIEACTDEAQLQQWFDRALTASGADEVFEPSAG